MYILVKADRREVLGLTEKRLISKLKNKDKKALDILIKEYSPYVYTIVRNIIGQAMSKEDMEEVAADCFIRLWQISEKLDENRPISPYLAACARNCAKNKLRELHTDYCADELFEDIVSSDSIQDSYEVSQQLSLITECLDGLSDTEQEIFVRFYYYGEKLRDISEMLEISESACKTKLCRTREKLRKYLAERGYTNERS